VFVQSESKLSINDYSQQIKDLTCEFQKIFSDFKSDELKFAMFSAYLITFDLEKAYGELKMKLIDIQRDSILKQKEQTQERTRLMDTHLSSIMN
jgi:hypothetical protein